MSVKTSSNKYPIDALTVLRASGQSAQSSTSMSSVIPLDVLTAYWMIGDVAEPFYFNVEIITESLTGTISFSVEIAQDSGFTTGVVVLAGTASVAAAGRASIVLSNEQITTALNGAATGFLSVVMTPAASSSAAWNAYLSPAEP